jgi:leukotriene-A4 hydrolase
LLDTLEASAPYSSAGVKKLDEAYGIHETENAEIRLRFYRIALKSGKEYAEMAASKSILPPPYSSLLSCDIG